MDRSTQQAAAPAPATDTLEGSSGLQDPTIQTALLQNPTVSRDQQVVLALLQASKQLQAAIADQCVGKVLAVLHAQHLQQVLCFSERWLPKHGSLLRELEVQLMCGSRCSWGYSRKGAAAVEALAAALEQQQLQLQAFSLDGAVAGRILQHLPAACLTRLCVTIDFYGNNSDSDSCSSEDSNRDSSSNSDIIALTCLTSVRSLDVHEGYVLLDAAPNALQPIAALQQLTELCLGTVTPKQLQLLRLPPLLQHVDVIVALYWEPQHLRDLAGWLKQHGSIVRRLALTRVGYSIIEEWEAAVHHFAAALQLAGSAPLAELPAAATGTAAAAAAATASSPSPTAATGGNMPLQSFKLEKLGAGPILQCLSASRLTHLQCGLEYSSAKQWEVLCALTALRSLSLDSIRPYKGGSFVCLHEQPSDVLAPLLALKQLTQLRLEHAQPEQLQHLPPWLRALDVVWLTARTEPLRLGHLTGLSALVNSNGDIDKSRTPYGLGPTDMLPPKLHELKWSRCCSMQPLLALSCLESLYVVNGIGGTPAELQQLSKLPRLTAVHVKYMLWIEQDAAVAAAWRALPLKHLEVLAVGGWNAPAQTSVGVPAAVVQQLSTLQGLTRLHMSGYAWLEGTYAETCWCSLEATPAQLAAALRPLTTLQQLQVDGFTSMLGDCACSDVNPHLWTEGASQHSAAGVAACVEAVCGLASLDRLHFELPVRLDSAAQQQLASMTVTQLLQLGRFSVKVDALFMSKLM